LGLDDDPFSRRTNDSALCEDLRHGKSPHACYHNASGFPWSDGPQAIGLAHINLVSKASTGSPCRSEWTLRNIHRDRLPDSPTCDEVYRKLGMICPHVDQDRIPWNLGGDSS